MPNKDDRAVAESFLKETIGHTADELCVVGGNVAIFPFRKEIKLPLPPFGVVSVGTILGEVRKGRLVPHHHFFMTYGEDCLSQIALAPDDERVRQYLAGEEIDVPTELKGYTAVLLKLGNARLTLGGGKAVGGRLKNYYPKGLRV